MADATINHEKKTSGNLSCNNQSPEVLLVKIIDLEESLNRYAAIFDNSPVGYVILDTRGVIINANLTAAMMVEMQQEDMVGFSFMMLVSEWDKQLFSDHLWRCEVTRARVCTEFQIKSRSHNTYYIQIISVPFLLHDGQTVHYNTAIIDLSNQKRLEQELQRLDRLNLVGEMAAGIAHEIRNPMTTVHGYLQLFKKKSSNPKDRQDLQLMLDELDRANAIITEFLALAKNKNNKLVLQSLNNMVQAVYPLIQAEALLAGNEIFLELCPNLPEVLIDSKEMRQVLLNLVTNALQAMKHGKVTIHTFIEEGKVVLAVEDQGHGIPDAIRNKIGTPFFTTKDNGTGLGMAICYSIVRRHNATLEFKTDPYGTTFFIRFPREVNLV